MKEVNFEDGDIERAHEDGGKIKMDISADFNSTYILITEDEIDEMRELLK